MIMESAQNKPPAIQRIKGIYYRMFARRRRHIRVPLRVKVTNRHTELFEHFTSANISVGGIFLKAESPYGVGTSVSLEFSLPETDNKVNTEGKVVRIVLPDNPHDLESGMGIIFSPLSQKDHDAINKYVKGIAKKVV